MFPVDPHFGQLVPGCWHCLVALLDCLVALVLALFGGTAWMSGKRVGCQVRGWDVR